MTPERKAEIRQRFRVKHLEDALSGLSDAVEALTEEDDYQTLWEAVGAAERLIRQQLQVERIALRTLPYVL